MHFNDLKAERAAYDIAALIENAREQGFGDTSEPLASLLAADRELSRARTAAFNIIRRARHGEAS